MGKNKRKNGLLVFFMLLICALMIMPNFSQSAVCAQSIQTNANFAEDNSSLVDITVTISYAGIDWEVAGYKTFDEYFNAELAGLTPAPTKGADSVTITTKATKGVTYASAFAYHAYIPSFYTAVVADSSKVVSDSDKTISISFKRGGTQSKEEIEGTDWYESLIVPILGWFDNAFYVIVIVVSTAGMMYAIYLGVQLARAESGDKRDSAKKHMLWFILAFALTIVVLIVLNILIDNVGVIQRLIY